MTKVDKKKIVTKLRLRGLSYRQIQKLTGVSKGSISSWCVGIKLTDKQRKKLYLAKINGQKKAAMKGGQINHEKSLKKKEEMIKKGYRQIKKMTINERFLVGVALYMAEGTKVGSSVEFTNSDPKAIVFMADWLEKYCEINRNKLKFSLWLHQGLDESSAIRYWCNLLNVEKSQFGKTYFAEVRGTRKSNFHESGIIKIRYYNVDCLNRIKGWIEGVFQSN
jgi:hypothetical protein